MRRFGIGECHLTIAEDKMMAQVSQCHTRIETRLPILKPRISHGWGKGKIARVLMAIAILIERKLRSTRFTWVFRIFLIASSRYTPSGESPHLPLTVQAVVILNVGKEVRVAEDIAALKARF